jgi:hypothetical protein
MHVWRRVFAAAPDRRRKPAMNGSIEIEALRVPDVSQLPDIGGNYQS